MRSAQRPACHDGLAEQPYFLNVRWTLRHRLLGASLRRSRHGARWEGRVCRAEALRKRFRQECCGSRFCGVPRVAYILESNVAIELQLIFEVSGYGQDFIDDFFNIGRILHKSQSRVKIVSASLLL